MKVEQIKNLVNTIQKEIVGEQALQTEDLTNVVDMGREIFNVTDVENYVKKLIDHIGRVVFVDRAYTGSAPSVLMDGWEFGSVMEKIQADIPEATENETWKLQDGASYDPNIVTLPKISAKFFNSKVTFEVPMTFQDKTVKSAFDNATQLNAFFSMIYNSIDKSMTIKIDGLVMRTINNAIAETIQDNTTKGGLRVVKLLTAYNTAFGTELTAEQAIKTPEFIRFANQQMALYKGRLAKMSKLFNVGGKDRFTPADKLHIILHDEYTTAAESYLYADTYHNELVKGVTNGVETVSYWQGSGVNYALADTTKINVKTSSGNTVEATYVIGVMFDRDALGVCNQDRYTTSQYNARAEFTNTWSKFDCTYFNDLNENLIVFQLV